MNYSNRRKAFLLCALCIISLLLTACGGKGSSNGKGSRNNPYHVGDTIKFTSYYAGLNMLLSDSEPIDVALSVEEVYDPASRISGMNPIDGDLGDVIRLKFSVAGDYNNGISENDLFTLNLLTTNMEQQSRYRFQSVNNRALYFDTVYCGGDYEVYAVGPITADDYKYCTIDFNSNRDGDRETIYIVLS